jgi:hypothetical protein
MNYCTLISRMNLTLIFIQFAHEACLDVDAKEGGGGRRGKGGGKLLIRSQFLVS